eukprot:6213247-Pleurochrysis_carterae.AAC.3
MYADVFWTGIERLVTRASRRRSHGSMIRTVALALRPAPPSLTFCHDSAKQAVPDAVRSLQKLTAGYKERGTLLVQALAARARRD